MDLPQIVLPTPLYNALLCSLIVMACWHVITLADNFRKRLVARKADVRDRRNH